jgi:hypothetical protein
MRKAFLIFTTALAFAVAVPAGMAFAGGCANCGVVKRTCQQATVGTFRSCRLDARAKDPGSARRDAIRACRTSFRTSHQDCQTALHGCLGDCHNPPPPGTCQGDCFNQKLTCMQGVIADGQSCVAACPSSGHDKARCRFACAQQAKTGLEDCLSKLHSCIAACPGSASGAFLD